MSAKILIMGLPNSGKTSLLKTLKNTLVISRDGKPFSLELPHVNIPDHDKNSGSYVDHLLGITAEKLDAYTSKMGSSPNTIVFDSVSAIFTEIVIYCTCKYDNFKIWENVDIEINKFTNAINELQTNGYNVVLISHVVYDADSKNYTETTAGKFGKKGGFLATVDYAIHISMVGSKYIVRHKGNNISRTLLGGMPEKEDADRFNLQDYVEKIQSKSDVIAEKWSI